MLTKQRGDDREEHHDAVEQHRHDDRRDDAGETTRSTTRHAHDLERVDLLADAACAELGADRRAGDAREHQRRDDRGALADDGQRVARTGEPCRADLLGQHVDLQREDDAERDAHRERRQGADRDREPGLPDRLLDGEPSRGDRCGYRAYDCDAQTQHLQRLHEEGPGASTDVRRWPIPLMAPVTSVVMCGAREPRRPCDAGTVTVNLSWSSRSSTTSE